MQPNFHYNIGESDDDSPDGVDDDDDSPDGVDDDDDSPA